MPIPQSRREAVAYLRANPHDAVAAAMFHDHRVEALGEDPLADPLIYHFQCTRREWLDWGPLLTILHPITRLTLTDFSPDPDLGFYVYDSMEGYEEQERGASIDKDDVPNVWFPGERSYSYDAPGEATRRVHQAALDWAHAQALRIPGDPPPGGVPPVAILPLTGAFK